MFRRIPLLAAALAIGSLAAGPAFAAEEVNIYTSRHYAGDQKLYDLFTEKTGIAVNRIEGKGPALLERLKAEGAASPADIFMTVDAGMFWRAEEAGVFQPIESKLLEERIPAYLRDPEGRWFGFSKRARVIYIDKAKVKNPPERYEDLAKDDYKGEICIRSSSNIYNLSLMASIIDADGEKAAQAWADGIVANMARDPQGGDTDQIRAVAAGACTIAVGNTYYYVRLLRSDEAADKEVVEKVGMIFPNQGDRGTHVNVSGAGVTAHAPNKANAVAFLEFMASDAAQEYFADGNNEYPAVPGVAANSAVVSLGTFKEDKINVSKLGELQPEAQKTMDRAGWK